MTLEILGHEFGYEMECITRLFYPGIRIDILKKPSGCLPSITTAAQTKQNQQILTVRVAVADFLEERQETIALDAPKAETERRMAGMLFTLLCKQTGRRPAWGILTGVRPVRFFQSLMQEHGLNTQQLYGFLEQNYLVQPQKIALALETAEHQKEVIRRATPNRYSLYISIPFCPTRCLYCSFVSHAIGKTMRLVPDYVERLCEEIRYTGAILRESGHILQTVYMGGGTPTTLSPDQLAKVLQTVQESFSLHHLEEYTVEAGRPDTITPEKLQVLRDFNVERVSINPQTMNDALLRSIGRGHTVQQVLEGIEMARQAGFSCINMDLIAGLPGDTEEGFADTLRQVLKLEPENITVHTLTVKRSSTLRGREDAFEQSPLDMENVLQHAQQNMAQAGYVPYYLYRQKGTVQNLENTGFTKPGFAGMYNVYSMEENQTIVAVGAGGVSKLCTNDGNIRRIFNYKYPYEYLKQFNEILRRKEALKEYTQCEVF